jgi:(2R)-ethylmalonyl-CoA mutase
MKLNDRPPWIIRTYAGFGDAEASNARYRANLARGQRGLSVAFDLPTQNGYDSDHPMAQGEVGGTGVAVCHMGDMERLFEDIPLHSINTSMTINATAPWLFALYLALAERQGAPRDMLRGTTQNDLMKEFTARGTHIFTPDTSLRLSRDLMEYAAKHVPRWNPINCCGYHYMESGASAAQEVGFALGNAALLLDAIAPVVKKVEFEPIVNRISFFINSGIELVTEIAKVRAYAQLWRTLCAEEFGVDDARFRAGCQVRSLTLTANQPEVNIVRIALQSLPAVLSASARVGALQLPGFREALSLPDQAEQTLSLRTQQVIMYETDIADHPDIFDGSIVIEEKTASICKEARAIVDKMRAQGYEKSIHWVSEQLTEALVQWQADFESGDRIVVGGNAFQEPIGLMAPTADPVAESNQIAVERHLTRLEAWRTQRNEANVEARLQTVKDAYLSGSNVVSASMGLALAGGTTGEWTQAIEDVGGGRYTAPLGLTSSAQQAPLHVPTTSIPVRLVLGKAGLDGHVNAAKLLAVACSRAGFEVIYTGIKQSPDALVSAAIEENADVLGISSLSGAHIHIATAVLSGLEERGADDLPVVMGGVIPEADIERLLDLGIRAVFSAGQSSMGEIIQTIVDLVQDPDEGTV